MIIVGIDRFTNAMLNALKYCTHCSFSFCGKEFSFSSQLSTSAITDIQYHHQPEHTVRHGLEGALTLLWMGTIKCPRHLPKSALYG